MSTFKAIDKLRVDSSNTVGFTLADIDPAQFASEPDKDIDKGNEEIAGELAELQEKLYANLRANVEGTPSLLIVLQGMDTSGKGGAVKSLYAAMDPQGITLHGFSKPTEEEQAHDFLWRIRNAVPRPGQVAIFDRSHYEDVLIQRVEGMAPMDEIMNRYPAIVEFEKELVAGGTRVVKVMLHISKDFQKENLLKRVEKEKKYWKYDPADLKARAKWDEYQQAYELAISRTATDDAPWYVLPSDNKKYARMLLNHIVLEQLRAMDLSWPEPSFDPGAERAKIESA